MTPRALLLPLLVLIAAHALSTAMRTLPAVAADVISGSLGIGVEDLAGITGSYYLAFALSQIPLGIALDRFGIRPVSLTLLIGTAISVGLAAIAQGPASFLVSQLAFGVATSGMLMTPMTLAARELPPGRFGLWSGVILALGNTGMLISGSPLAWLVETSGWRASYLVGGAAALVIAVLVALFVPREKAAAKSPAAPAQQFLEALRLGLSPSLRGIMALAFVSLAATLVVRGLWGGPWLIEEKGLSRVETGHVLGLYTLALIAGPVVIGMGDRRLGKGREIVIAGHIIGAALLVSLAAGARGGPLSALFGVEVMPAGFDAAIFVLLGLTLSAQPVLYSMATRQVAAGNTGKTLAAVNLAYFVGMAAVQSATGPVVSWLSLPAVFVFLAVLLLVGLTVFVRETRPGRAG